MIFLYKFGEYNSSINYYTLNIFKYTYIFLPISKQIQTTSLILILRLFQL